MSAGPGLSVVIPTRDRRSSLLRTLRSLGRQTLPYERFEVIVVDDGSTDGTAGALSVATLPFGSRTIRVECSSAAAARNAGARLAEREILLFLDDDVEATPALLAEHLAAHVATGPRAVIGPYPPVPGGTTGPVRRLVRRWWEDHFRAMALPGHRHGYRDVVSGNLSLPRALFDDLGGFDERIDRSRCEDWELGARLVAAGVPIECRPTAIGLHHDAEGATLERSLRVAWSEGRAFARIDRLHPGLAGERADGGPLASGAVLRAVRGLTRRAPVVAGLGATALRIPLACCARFRLRAPWRHLFGLIRLTRFWRGYFAPIDRPIDRARPSVDEIARPKRIVVDLADSLDGAMDSVDRERPDEVRLVWNGASLGTIRVEPGVEPLRGEHLGPLLRQRFHAALAERLLVDAGFRRHPGAQRR